jgi:triphosphoribosyl-dephospho-CoA synthase
LSVPLSSATIASAFEAACVAELDALKPGNVHRYGEGHGMSVADFETSARVAAPYVAEPDSSVGLRIRHAIEATAAAVGHNTNLGIVLLCAPLASAALASGGGTLRKHLANVLETLSVEDAKESYAAIRLAKAGGLGTVEKHDLGSEPEVTLLEAMREAEGHDRIAWNYTHEFADIFVIGMPRLIQGRTRYGGHEWAVTDLYLSLLAAIPDTLVARKFGVNAATQVTENACKTLKAFVEAETAEARVDALLTFDKALKDRGFNPGTTADLTVATLFASSLQAMEIGA